MKWLTCWTWDPSNERAIYEGFLNMLKKRFREIMMQLIKKATKLSYKAGENVDLRNSNQFRIIRKYIGLNQYLSTYDVTCVRLGTQKHLHLLSEWDIIIF
ncbi:hypothetical protein Hanom_Chr04g00344601 [Helianthus anomalus]